MLSLPDQPHGVSNEQGGYFFWDGFMGARDTVCSRRPIEQWDRSELEGLRRTFQQNLAHIEARSRAAITQGKVFFAKEHTLWLADPAATTQYLATTDRRSHEPPMRLGVQMPTAYVQDGVSSSRAFF